MLIQNRFETLARLSFHRYLQTAPQDDRQLVSRFFAAESYLDVLETIQGTDELDLIKADLDNSRTAALNNLYSIGRVFGSFMNRILKKLHKISESVGDPSLRQTHQNSINRLCLLISSLPEWPSKVRKDYCIGTQMRSIFSDEFDAGVISEEHLARPFSIRSCVHRDFFRRNKIYQDWHL